VATLAACPGMCAERIPEGTEKKKNWSEH